MTVAHGKTGWFRRLGGVGAAVVAALLLVWAVAHAIVDSEAMQGRLLARARAELAERTALVTLGDRVRVDWLGRVELGPVFLHAAPGAPPFAEIGSLRLRPSYRALLRGELVPGSVTLAGVRVDAGERGQHLREFAANARHAPAAPSGPPPKSGGTEALAPVGITLFLQDLTAVAPLDGKPVVLVERAHGRLTVERDGRGDRAWATLAFSDEGRIRMEARLDENGSASLDVKLERLGSRTVGPEVWAALPGALTSGVVDGRLELRAEQRGRAGRASLALSASAAELRGERLAARPVGPIDAGLEADWTWSLGERRLTLERAEAWLGADREAKVRAEGELTVGPSGRLRFVAEAKDLQLAKLVAALPPQLRPDSDAPSCQGPLSAHFSIRGPWREPEAWEVVAKLDLRLLHPKDDAERPFVLDAFEYQPVDAKGRSRQLWIGPPSPTYVSLGSLPEHVTRAVLTSEDAGFYGHQGFEFTEIHDSLIAAIRGTRFRGASTVTQQLAKNLYLSRERTLARKVKEALITIALEVLVPKDRLFEVYLNVIEWGPNLYGLGEASQHYFGVDASQLSVKQAVFLATIIPNPNRYYGYFVKKALTPTWEERVRTLIDKLYEAGYLEDAEYEQALVMPLVFRDDPTSPPGPAPN